MEVASSDIVVQEATEFEDPSLEDLPLSFEALTVTQAGSPAHQDEEDDVQEIEASHYNGSPDDSDTDNPSTWLAKFEPRLSEVPSIDWSGQVRIHCLSGRFYSCTEISTHLGSWALGLPGGYRLGALDA